MSQFHFCVIKMEMSEFNANIKIGLRNQHLNIKSQSHDLIGWLSILKEMDVVN